MNYDFILYTFLLMTILLIKIITICYLLHKHWSKKIILQY